MIGKVERYLLARIQEEKAIFIPLIDPEEVTAKSASFLAEEEEKAGASAIMIGGSTVVSPKILDNIVKAIKESTNIPVILFPNNITGVSKYADAIWFMSLLNSADPYFIIGAQVLAASDIVRMVKSTVNLPLLVGGGIRTKKQAKEIARAGADIIVASTVLENENPEAVGIKTREILEGIKEGASHRYMFISDEKEEKD